MNLQCESKAEPLNASPPALPDSRAWGYWDFWLDTPRTPAGNMAIDEALLASAPQRGRTLLRFYEWDRPAVSLGFMQAFRAAPTTGYAVVRRPTGGGVVFHDHDFTYSVVAPVGSPLADMDKMEAYNSINHAVCAGLERLGIAAHLSRSEIADGIDRRTMVCFQHPTRYDVTAFGRKVAGSAQRRTPTGVLHQGSLHFGGPLPMAREKLVAALRESFRVTFQIKWTAFSPGRELLLDAARIEQERYGRATWTRRR